MADIQMFSYGNGLKIESESDGMIIDDANLETEASKKWERQSICRSNGHVICVGIVRSANIDKCILIKWQRHQIFIPL